MAQITIEVPERLSDRLDEVKERLSHELALWPEPSNPPFTEVYRYVLEFLASTPPPEAILKFKMTAEMQERIRYLLEKNRSAQLTPAESAELDEYVRIDNLVSLLKTRTSRALQAVR